MLTQQSLPVILKQGGHDVLQEETGCHHAQRLLFMTSNESRIDVVLSAVVIVKYSEHFTVKYSENHKMIIILLY